MASGDELLILDTFAPHRGGMRQLFEQVGYVCATPATTAEALTLAKTKFFAGAVISLDLERPGGGLDAVRVLREQSRQTGIVLLTGRRSYEAAVEALRLGVTDVVVKRTDQVAHLKAAVELACDRHRVRGDEHTNLLEEVAAVLEEAFRGLMALARQVYATSGQGSEAPPRLRVLVVDAEARFFEELSARVSSATTDLVVETSGGAALDLASTRRFDVVLCRDELPDLPGTLLVKSVQAVQPDIAAYIYTKPGAEGSAQRYEEGRPTSVERPFRGATHLVELLEAVAVEHGTTEKERRVLRLFRADHEDFLRRYARLKLRVERVLSR